jgi:hypothetical protein
MVKVNFFLFCISLFSNRYLMPLVTRVDHPYRSYRWSVGYAKEGWVMISAQPPMNRSDDQPWESWYTNGKVPLLHHVHYTKPNALAKESSSWKEYPGAPQQVIKAWFNTGKTSTVTYAAAPDLRIDLSGKGNDLQKSGSPLFFADAPANGN